ncbi:amino acid adenylation domain-containing protein [Pseudoalteromonas sp. MMG012]|uniref:amino acid adenylation domain-containing protein n=1 Tax=Pseudoalteromonas sp. MMG012 TaxID=2822686 RepID=UPI001B3A6F9A|nr:amino acid adenylation domain-containing protein [Pseudoalteromonas sp. MMG012]MBQ4850300.1 amino acid adenylation domain-containing protein [Pseudoalteromonas sp. MMG012]
MNNKVLASPIQRAHWNQLKNTNKEQLNTAAISAVYPGMLNAQSIEAYLHQLVGCFDILRTHYETDELGALWQHVATDMPIHFSTVNWHGLNEYEVTEQKKKESKTPSISSVTVPWIRVVVAEMVDSCWLHLEVMGLNTDVFSLNYLAESLIDAGNGRLQDAQGRLHDEVIQYEDLAPWLGDFLLDEELLDARKFWSRDKSERALEQKLSLQRYVQATESAYAFATMALDDLYDPIASYAFTHQVSIAEVICASLRHTLKRYSSDAVLSRVFDSRADCDLADAIGPLSRAVPLFPDMDGVFDTAIKQEQALSEQGVDYGECFIKSHDHETSGFSFIFDSIERSSASHCDVEQIISLSEALKIQFIFINQGKNSRLQFTYDTGYMDEQAMAYFVASCKADLIKHIGEVRTQEQHAYQGRGDTVAASCHSVLDQFTNIADTTGGSVIQIDGKKHTFADINDDANRLANCLIAAGIGHGDVIALCLTRSIEFVIAMLGIMKTGAAYVPVDIDLPAQRISAMIQDAQASSLICQGDVMVEGCHSINYAELDLHEYDTTAPAIKIAPDDLAYILFTSGSTGKAKGVSISHKALLNHMTWINEEFKFNSQDRFLQRTSASFDASIWEFWSPLMVGATMVIAPQAINYDQALFKQTLTEQHITRMQIVPSLLDLLIESNSESQTYHLDTIFCGGEALRTITALNAKNAFNCDVVNLYGPSECCIDALFWRFDERLQTDFVPIGYPINNLNCRVITEGGQVAEIGESGELQISGDSVFSGYYGQDELTAAALEYCDLASTKFYKTGDHVQILSDGNLMYLERLDDQVKLNGFRIEPEEVSMFVINNGLSEQAQCKVVGNSLSLFYIGAKVSEQEIILKLKGALPEYMVPTQLIELEEFSYLSNGKLDSKALVTLALNYTSADYVMPSTDVETKLVAIWQELLDTSMTIGTSHDFFNIGGHSLLAMKVLNRIQEQFEVNISVRVLFQNKTIAELAAYLEPMILLNATHDSEVSEMEGGLL